MLAVRSDAILLSSGMADFLQVQKGDTMRVLLVRGTSEQVEIEMELVGSFERPPGFPDGADVLMNINRYEAMVASTPPPMRP